SQARTLPPNAPELYLENGELNWANSTWNNPLRLMNINYRSRTDNLIGNLVVKYELFSGLEFKTSLGYNDLYIRETKATPSSYYNPAFGYGSERASLLSNTGKLTSWIIEPQILSNLKIGHGELELLI